MTDPVADVANGAVLVPVTDLRAYDDLDAVGDDGWSVERLLVDVRVNGIREPLEVAHSAAQMAVGDDAVYVFNGTHRLSVARALDLDVVPAVPAWRSEDAVYAQCLFEPRGDIYTTPHTCLT